MSEDHRGTRVASFFVSHSSADRSAVAQLCDHLQRWGYESIFLDFDPDVGIAVGREWERELYRQMHAADAVVFVASRASTQSRWCFAELTLARSARKPIFPVAIEQGVERGLLADRQWLELADENGSIGRLERALRAQIDPRDTLAWDASRIPYPGLLAFEAGDAGVFFGRDAKVAEVIERLDATLGRGRCVAVVGASGSGKSSLLRAGVVPRLTRSRERWVVVGPLTPGERPVGALARALAPALGRDREALQQRIEADAAALTEYLRDLTVTPEGAERAVAIVVDQAEELVVQASAGERRRFVAALEHALASDLAVWVLATVRSEFLGATLDDGQLAEMITDTVLLAPLESSRVPQVILGPARRAGLEFSPGLVERMATDTQGGDALPLLAYTLRELYDRDRADPGVIAEADYDAIGGVEGALRRRADLVQRELAGRGLGELVLPTLLRLVTLDAEEKPVRRRLARSALSVAESEVVRGFAEARLLVIDGDLVTVAHEALLRAWEPLRDAIQRSREQLAIEADLRRDAEQWAQQGRRDSYLLSGDRLVRARGVQTAEPLQQEFLDASAAVQARRRRRTVVGLSAAFAAITAAALISFWQFGVARERAAEAQSQRLAILALSTLGQNDDQAAILSLEAYRTAPTFEARNAILTILPRIERSAGSIAVAGTDAVNGVALSPDGRTVVSGDAAGKVRFWDARSLRPRGGRLGGDSKVVYATAYSPDGRVLATGGRDGTVRLWDAASHEQLAALPRRAGAVFALAFSADGSTLAATGAGGSVQVWDVDARAVRVELPARPVPQRRVPRVRLRPTNHRYGVAFSPDGHMLASAGRDGVRVWDVDSGRELGYPLQQGGGFGVAFVTDQVLASTDDAGFVHFWDLDTFEELGEPTQGHDGTARSLAISPDRRLLASGGFDGSVRLWDARTRQPIGEPLTGHAPETAVMAVGFSRDGGRLASAGGDGTVRLWDVGGGRALGTKLVSGAYRVWGSAFGPDGRTLATAGGDGKLRLWDVRARRALGSPLAGTFNATGEVFGLGGQRLAFSGDGRTLASTGADGTVQFWDTRLRRALGPPLKGHASGVMGVGFSPDGRTLASAGGGVVRLWDVAARRDRGNLLTTNSSLSVAAFSPDGRTVATASIDGTIWLVDVRTGRTTRLPGGVQWMWVAFSPDGRTLAAVGDRQIELWDVGRRQLIGGPLRIPEDSLMGVAFSPDGNTFATADLSAGIRLWDTRTRRPLGSPLSGPAKTPDVAAGWVQFSPDGRTIAAEVGSDVWLWDSILWDDRYDAFQSRICAAVRRDLTRAEWAALIPGRSYHRTCA